LPGTVATRWFLQGMEPQEVAAQELKVAESTPLAKIATPDAVAQAVMCLLATDFVTGHALVVDGGKSLIY